MKIDNWGKLSGITYKGYCIVNPIHNVNKTFYEADILDLNHPSKARKWKMELTMTEMDDSISPNSGLLRISEYKKTPNANVNVAQKYLRKEHLYKISIFRGEWEVLLEELIMMDEWEKHRPNIVSTNTNSGIISNVMNSGTTIDYGKMMQEMLDSIKQSDEALSTLKEYINKL